MKNRIYLTLLILSITHFGIIGQTATMSTGGWRTSTENPKTRITATNNLSSKIYRINCITLVDATILQFRIIVDGTPIQPTFQEGSFVVVEGKEIFIEQTTPGAMIIGTWTIVQESERAALTLPWNYYTSLTNDLLIASLKVEQEFLLSINSTSINCTGTSFTIFIDGQAVKDANNNIMKFLEGSTIYGKGKNILIRASGSCTLNSPIVGDLKLSK